MRADKILLIGARGQLGTALLPALQEVYGTEAVVASDLLPMEVDCIFEQFDATDAKQLARVVEQHKISQVYHLAAMLSAKGEQNPVMTWQVNMQSFINVLEVARNSSVDKIFIPSSIAVFGDHCLSEQTPQFSSLNPGTMYGVTKVGAENLSQYYYHRYGLDIRSVRYPGIISHQSLAGGGTTDYAVDMYHKAVLDEPFECYLLPETRLPMMYIEDAIRATVELMEAPSDQISVRSSYNLQALSFSPAELYQEIQRFLPSFSIQYHADYRQKIADSWPLSLDDSPARADWNWKPAYDLPEMTKEMIQQLSVRYGREIAWIS